MLLLNQRPCCSEDEGMIVDRCWQIESPVIDAKECSKASRMVENQKQKRRKQCDGYSFIDNN